MLAWHPAQAEELLRREYKHRKVEVVPPQPGVEFDWVCPVPKCGHGIVAAAPEIYEDYKSSHGRNYHHRLARQDHARTRHPKVDKKLFLDRVAYKGKQANLGANQAKIQRYNVWRANFTAANRVMRRKEGVAAHHKTVRFIRLPSGIKVHPGSKTCKGCKPDRPSVVFCADCGRFAHGLKTLAKEKCIPKESRAPVASVQDQLDRRLKNKRLPAEEKKELEEFGKLILTTAAASSAATATAPASSSHGADNE